MWVVLVTLALAVALQDGAAAGWPQMPGTQTSQPSQLPSAKHPFVIEELTTAFRFENDGSGSRRLRAVVLVNDERGVGHWGTLQVPYMSALEAVALRELVVEKADGRRVHVPDAPLEEVTVSGQVDEPIVSDWRAKKVTVPSLQPGDRLRYDVEISRSGSLIPKQFWIGHAFTRTAVVKNELLEIDVPAARNVRFTARRGEEEGSRNPASERRLLRWKHQQIEPLAVETDEKALESVLEDAKQGPDVILSSFTEWGEVAKWFDEVVSERATPDDAVRGKAMELTKGIQDTDKKLAALFTFVSTKIRYVSLAFGAGRLEPRPASQVLATEYGDCKDKHVLLASLARAIGIEIRPVLISGDVLLNERVPSPGQFDHVVSVRTEGVPAQWLWMDTTSGVLPPGALLAQYREKKALLATSAAPATQSYVVDSPMGLPTPTQASIEIQGSISERTGLTAKSTRRLVGDFEYVLRFAIRAASQQQRLELAKALALEDGLRDAKVVTADFKDEGPGVGVKLSYEASQDYTVPIGKPWQIWLPSPSLALPEAPDSGPMQLGEPGEIALSIQYKLPAGVRVRPPVAVKLDREFGTYTSSYLVEGRTLRVERRIKILARKLEPPQFAAYGAFRRAIDADYRQTFSAEPLTTSGSTAGTADQLAAAGYQAVEDHDYARAVELLKQATAADPKHKYAWNNLGRAYIALGDYPAAVTALTTQVAVNPYDEYAYANLGHTLRLLGKTDEAIVQLKKQIEVSPLDKYAHGELGRLYVELDRPAEAEEWLQKAISLSSQDSSLWVELGKARLAAGKEADAIAAFNRSIELAPNPATWNNVAWALAEKGVRLDMAESHVRSAIDAAAAALRTATLEGLRPVHLALVSSLSAYWDTLGWIHFQRGDLEKAEPWLRAAWMLGEDRENAHHLAQLYERQGRREAALEFYALALAAGRELKESRSALERLVGAEQANSSVVAAREQLVKGRTVTLPRLTTEKLTREVYLLVEAGRISGVRFVPGDERVRELEPKLAGVRIPFLAPNDQPVRVIRQASIACSEARGCILVLIPATTARMPSR